ncbi:MAG: contractile injection system tape measure protein [Bacteroidia bacterium]|nr:contractile injection system tape measure protein [Bacteroidia bacterium]
MTAARNTHRIDSANVSVHLNDVVQDVDSEALRRWTIQVLLEELDVAATDLCPPDQWYVLPTFSVVIDIHGEDFLRDAPSLRMLLRDALRTRLLEQLDSAGGRSEIVYYSAIVLEYLATGTLSAARRGTRLHTALNFFIEHLSAMDQGQHASVIEVLRQPDAYTRFLRHIGNAPLYELLHLYSGGSPELWRLVVRALPPVLRKHPSVFRMAEHDEILRYIFAVLSGMETPQTAGMQEILRRVLAMLRSDRRDAGKYVPVVSYEVMADMAEALSAAGLAADSETVAVLFSLSPAEVSSPDDEIAPRPGDLPPSPLLIENAGIVLLAPFLQTFLASVDGLDHRGNLRAPERLPIFLHYLATGERVAEEWQLTVHKILAGLDTNALCDTELLISEEEVLLTSDLLHSVIGLWDKLQGTSIAGLRETFLQRPGTLSPQSPHWRLRVHEEAVDILLQFVPWPFHTVRLPWMNGILLVDW